MFSVSRYLAGADVFRSVEVLLYPQHTGCRCDRDNMRCCDTCLVMDKRRVEAGLSLRREELCLAKRTRREEFCRVASVGREDVAVLGKRSGSCSSLHRFERRLLVETGGDMSKLREERRSVEDGTSIRRDESW